MAKVESDPPPRIPAGRIAAECLLCAAAQPHHRAVRGRRAAFGRENGNWLMQAPTLPIWPRLVDASRHGRRGGTRCPCEIKCINRVDHTAFFLTV